VMRGIGMGGKPLKSGEYRPKSTTAHARLRGFPWQEDAIETLRFDLEEKKVITTSVDDAASRVKLTSQATKDGLGSSLDAGLIEQAV